MMARRHHNQAHRQQLRISKLRSLCGVDTTGLAASLPILPVGLACHGRSSEHMGGMSLLSSSSHVESCLWGWPQSPPHQVQFFFFMLFNVLNNIYMLWSQLLYDTLFANNMYMLVIYLLYIEQFVNNICMVFVVHDLCCSKIPTKCLFSVCNAPGPMSSPDLGMVSNLTVYHKIIMVVWLGIIIML